MEDKYVGPLYCRAEMYAGRVACCPLMSHVMPTEHTDTRADAQTFTLHFLLSIASIKTTRDFANAGTTS